MIQGKRNGVKLLDDIHDQWHVNDSDVRQFEDYLEISSDNYTNFAPIPEYHNYYEEFPTVYLENVSENPPEKKEVRKRGEEEGDSSSSDGSSASATAASSSGSASAGSSVGASASASASASISSSSTLANISASQIISTTFVTLVAVSSIVIPIVDNADLDVGLDASFNGGILYYMIELTNTSDVSEYYAVVMEDQTVISETIIVGGFQSDSISGLNGSKEHRVEVRTGTPPLLVVGSVVIPGEPVWVEWNGYTADYHSISYSLTLHGYAEATTVNLYDAETGASVYLADIQEGEFSDTISDLKDGHAYELTVSTASETYTSMIVETQPPSVDIEYLSVRENIVDYGVVVHGDVSLVFRLYDSETMAIVYSSALSEGMNAGTVPELEFDHGYLAEVSSSDTVYYTASVTTESSTIEVEVVSFTAEQNTIGFEIIVKGNKKIATAEISSVEGGLIYSGDLVEGSNTGSIGELEYNVEYTLKVYSGDIVYATQSVTTGREDQKPSVSPISFFYGEAMSIQIGGLEEEPVITYAIQSGTSVAVDPVTGALTWLSAGITNVTASYAETEHYAAGSIDVKVTAYKATQPTDDSSFTFTYGGPNQLSVSGVQEDARVTYSVGTETVVTVTSSGVLTWVSAGEVGVTATIGGTEHYAEKDVTITVTAVKAAQNPSADAIKLQFGETKPIVVSGLKDSPEMSYNVRSGTSITVDESGVIHWVEVGDSTVRASFSGTAHYKAGYIDVSVTATKGVQPATDFDFTFTYAGEDQLEVDTLDEASVTFTRASGTSIDVTDDGKLTWVSAGDSTVTAIIAETDHYDSKEITITVTAEKAVQPATDFDFTFTQGGPDQLEVDTLDEASVTFVKASGTSIDITDDGKLTWVSAGDSTVTATIAETDYYDPKEITITVTATGSVTNLKVSIDKSNNLFWSADEIVGYWGLYICDETEAEFVEGVGIYEDILSGTIEVYGWNLDDIYKVYVNISDLTTYDEITAGAIVAIEVDVPLATYYATLTTDALVVTVNMNGLYSDYMYGLYTSVGEDPVLECEPGEGTTSFYYYQYSPEQTYYLGIKDKEGEFPIWGVVPEVIVTDLTVTYEGEKNYSVDIISKEDITGYIVMFHYDPECSFYQSHTYINNTSFEISQTSDGYSYVSKSGIFKTEYFHDYYVVIKSKFWGDPLFGPAEVTSNPVSGFSVTPGTDYISYTADVESEGAGLCVYLLYQEYGSWSVMPERKTLNAGDNEGRFENLEGGDYKVAVFEPEDYPIEDDIIRYGCVVEDVSLPKKSQEPSADPITFEYGQTKSIQVNELKEEPELSYSVLSGTSVTVDEDGTLHWENVGVSTVRASFTETNHYAAGFIDVEVTTVKADSEITEAPTAKTLDYNGSPQELVEGGECTGGTIMYYVSTTVTDPTQIPSKNWADMATATSAGDYYVYYMVAGDAYHNDIAASSGMMVQVTIQKLQVALVCSLGTDEPNKILADITVDGSSEFALSCYVTEADGTLLRTVNFSVASLTCTFGFLQYNQTYKVYVNEPGMTDPSSDPYASDEIWTGTPSGTIASFEVSRSGSQTQGLDITIISSIDLDDYYVRITDAYDGFAHADSIGIGDKFDKSGAGPFTYTSKTGEISTEYLPNYYIDIASGSGTQQFKPVWIKTVTAFTAVGGKGSIEYTADLTSSGTGLYVYAYQNGVEKARSEMLVAGQTNTGSFTGLAAGTYTVAVFGPSFGQITQKTTSKADVTVEYTPITDVACEVSGNDVTVTVTSNSLTSYDLSCYVVNNDRSYILESELGKAGGTIEIPLEMTNYEEYQVYINDSNLSDPSSDPYYGPVVFEIVSPVTGFQASLDDLGRIQWSAEYVDGSAYWYIYVCSTDDEGMIVGNVEIDEGYGQYGIIDTIEKEWGPLQYGEHYELIVNEAGLELYADVITGYVAKSGILSLPYCSVHSEIVGNVLTLTVSCNDSNYEECALFVKDDEDSPIEERITFDSDRKATKEYTGLTYGEYVVGLYAVIGDVSPSKMVSECPVIIPYATITFDHRTDSTLYGSVTSINDSGWETKNAVFGVYPDDSYQGGTTIDLTIGEFAIDYYRDVEDGMNYIGITIGTTSLEFVLNLEVNLSDIEHWK